MKGFFLFYSVIYSCKRCSSCQSKSASVNKVTGDKITSKLYKMEVGKILSADLLDIIFDGRNKNYGAYDLRKTYQRRLLEALLVTVALCIVTIGIPQLLSLQSAKKNVQMYVKDVSLEDLKQDANKLPCPPSNSSLPKPPHPPKLLPRPPNPPPPNRSF